MHRIARALSRSLVPGVLVVSISARDCIAFTGSESREGIAELRASIERAQASLPSFQATTANAATVRELCRALDGIPLALELAAARTRMMTPAEIAARLDERFRLLTGGSRTAVPHPGPSSSARLRAASSNAAAVPTGLILITGGRLRRNELNSSSSQRK